MSRFFSPKRAALRQYTPGEQPRGRDFIKLNTNESPLPPPEAVRAVCAQSGGLNLYPDPEGRSLRAALAAYHGVGAENISLGNGSDETLAFAFAAFCDEERGLAFPDVTYGFYPSLAGLFGIPCREIPVGADLSVNPDDYLKAGQTVVLANPNAPTGLALEIAEIERIALSNPEHAVIIDEAYADFWGETVIPLTRKYENLLAVRTYSKSRFMAGARLGYAVGSAALIEDLERVRNSLNPYNVNSVTLAAGEAALGQNDYYRAGWAELCETRDWALAELRSLGFEATDSKANFIFARFPGKSGRGLYEALRAAGFLVRQWEQPRIADWLRITVGTRAQLGALVKALEEIIK